MLVVIKKLLNATLIIQQRNHGIIATLNYTGDEMENMDCFKNIVDLD